MGALIKLFGTRGKKEPQGGTLSEASLTDLIDTYSPQRDSSIEPDRMALVTMRSVRFDM